MFLSNQWLVDTSTPFPVLLHKDNHLHVYSAKNDIAKLIGRKGVMANSIRQLMSVAGRLSDKKLDIKFESYE